MKQNITKKITIIFNGTATGMTLKMFPNVACSSAKIFCTSRNHRYLFSASELLKNIYNIVFVECISKILIKIFVTVVTKTCTAICEFNLFIYLQVRKNVTIEIVKPTIMQSLDRLKY